MNESEINSQTAISPSSAKDMEIQQDNDFSYEGYQVVRGEFFAHVFEPSFAFHNYKVSVNTACIRKLPDVEFVQILVNSDDKKLGIRPCTENEKDSFRWITNGKKRGPKQITCRIFFSKIISLMNWNPSYKYKLLGKLIQSGDELLFIFDLTTPEIYMKTAKEGEPLKTSRTPTYPAEWQNQFGIPVEEHQRSLQINTFDGYTVFGIQEPRKEPKPITPEEQEENKTHEQSDIFTTNPLY
ncbi:hypothetical protein EDD76_102240 [Kineothrix alysoides]|uniref:Uncharacterized protein n=1 Tax=Kineothrix alysoides TaxID=1469948 RepID=A0A4R1R5H8_9FIRM|nr:hypothetical protein [Kineothrix alysoides]TCL60542.1 hypothetical protein EDD76_102240 [Kineothrix alysoides]